MITSKRGGIRRWLEALGLCLLIIGIWSERQVLEDSLRTLRHAYVLPLLISLGLAWLLFLWSSLGYKVLLQKPIRIRELILANLAAAGPGRVIPGGGGQISFGTLFLTKSKLSLPQALAVSVTNNLMGFIVNIFVLAVIFVLNPHLLKSLHISPKGIIVFLTGSVVIICIAFLARHNRNVKKKTSGTGRELKKVWNRLGSLPLKLLLLIGVMLLTTFTNSIILYFASRAVGLSLPLASAVVVLSTGVALGSLLPTPGGVGGVEAGLIASMYALGFPLGLATSAALLFRVATYIQPFIPGIFAYVWLRKKDLL